VQVLAEQGRARTATMKLPHYTAETPMFMPVGTQGTEQYIQTAARRSIGCGLISGRLPWPNSDASWAVVQLHNTQQLVSTHHKALSCCP